MVESLVVVLGKLEVDLDSGIQEAVDSDHILG